MTPIIERVARARTACLADNEEPRDLILHTKFKHALRAALESLSLYRINAPPIQDEFMGMKIQWVSDRAPSPLLTPDISIRTKGGDTRIVP